MIIVSTPRADVSAALETSRFSKGFQGSVDKSSFMRGSKKEFETRESLNTSTRSIPTVRRVHKTEAEKQIQPSERKSTSQSPKRDVSSIRQSPMMSTVTQAQTLQPTRSVT